MTYRVTTNWQHFRTILHSLNRQAELHRLVQWAQQKRLPGPLQCYQALLSDEEIRFNRYTIHNPRLTRWVRRFHRFYCLLVPPPRYPRAGSAALYRRNNLTHVC